MDNNVKEIKDLLLLPMSIEIESFVGSQIEDNERSIKIDELVYSGYTFKEKDGRIVKSPAFVCTILKDPETSRVGTKVKLRIKEVANRLGFEDYQLIFRKKEYNHI